MSSEVDTWDLFFRTDWGRDRELGRAINNVQQQAMTTQSRLSSQLSRLEGSIEKRLTALSEAFDAYVELGDVREQLRLLPDSRSVRQRVQRLLDQLTAGGDVELVEDGGGTDGLVAAMNAAACLCTGRPAATHEAVAEELDEGPLIVVLVCLAVGRGDALDGRLAALFEGVEDLAGHHQLLFRAVTEGLVPRREVVRLGEVLRPALGETEPWAAWLGQRGSLTPPERVEELFAGRRPTQPAPEQVPVADALRTAVASFVMRGSGQERELVERAHELRRRIEHPDATAPVVPQPVTVTAAVQQAIDSAGTEPWVREVLLEWVRPLMASLVEQWLQLPRPLPGTRDYRAQMSLPGAAPVRTIIPVTASGGDAEAIRKAKRDFQAAAAPTGIMGYRAGAVAGLACLLLLLTGQPILVVLGIAGAGAGAWCAWRAWSIQKRNRERAEGLAVAQGALGKAVDKVRDEVAAGDRDAAAAYAENQAVLSELLAQLRA